MLVLQWLAPDLNLTVPIYTPEKRGALWECSQSSNPGECLKSTSKYLRSCSILPEDNVAWFEFLEFLRMTKKWKWRLCYRAKSIRTTKSKLHDSNSIYNNICMFSTYCLLLIKTRERMIACLPRGNPTLKRKWRTFQDCSRLLLLSISIINMKTSVIF